MSLQRERTVTYAWLCDHLGVTAIELPHVVTDTATSTITMYFPATAPRGWGQRLFAKPAQAYPHITFTVVRVTGCPLLCLYGRWQDDARATRLQGST